LEYLVLHDISVSSSCSSQRGSIERLRLNDRWEFTFYREAESPRPKFFKRNSYYMKRARCKFVLFAVKWFT